MTTPRDSLFDPDFFIGELPEGYYQHAIERRQPRERRKRLSTMFSDIQRDYNKALVRFVAESGGQSPLSQPNLSTFRGFLDDFNLDEKYFEAAPEERYGSRQAFAPRTQFLFNR